MKVPKPLKEYRAKKYTKPWKLFYSKFYNEISLLVKQYKYKIRYPAQVKTIAFNLATYALDVWEKL